MEKTTNVENNAMSVIFGHKDRVHVISF